MCTSVPIRLLKSEEQLAYKKLVKKLKAKQSAEPNKFYYTEDNKIVSDVKSC